MGNKKAKRAYLVLADGTVFHGYSMGAAGETVGEVVFNTCTASYQSLLSDPTYYGQIVAQTYPLVGNRGVEEENAASNIMANGYIAREWYDTPCTGDGSLTLDEYLRRRNIVGICGIDTRRLTRALRDKGYFNGAITDSLQDFDALLRRIKAYTISGAVEAVTIREPEKIPAENPLYRVTVIDCGFPRYVLKALTGRGCELTLVPAFTGAQEILAGKPDGVIFSDGPGDPDDAPCLIDCAKALLESKLPLFGVGLGHQVMALAAGCTVVKMPKGHRGSNQPVRILDTGRIMVTMQNHGYSVAAQSIPHGMAEMTMANVNDGAVEGIAYCNAPAFSVEFTPSDGSGRQDTAWIYDAFIDRMKGARRNEAARD